MGAFGMGKANSFHFPEGSRIVNPGLRAACLSQLPWDSLQDEHRRDVFPGLASHSLLPPSTKTGKLRPRGAKDLLATSQSETSAMRARIGIEDLSWAKLCSTSWTGVLICLAALVNLDYPAPGAWMYPIETTRFSLPSPSESKHGY